LFYRAWLTDAPTDKALILFHRGHEHSGRFEELVQMLDLDDVAVFAWDARGHGRSPGDRGYAESCATFVRDADEFAKHLVRAYGISIENTVVLGHSVGAVIAAAWVHDYAPRVRAMVLAGPALRVKLYVPFARQVLRLRMLFGGRPYVTSYVKSRMLTHDAAQARAYDADPLISRQLAVNVLLDLHDTSTRLLNDAGGIRTPSLLLASGRDWVVKNRAIRTFFERLTSPAKELHSFDGFSHAIFHESRRELPIARVREFIRTAFEQPAGHRIDVSPDARSQQTYERLARPRPLYCPRGLWFRAQRVFLRTVGRLGDGIRLGWRNGFSSGQSLDHVYENRARGLTPLGRLIDRIYLTAPGWRGIRQRKVHLKELIDRAIDETLTTRQTAHVCDVAAGPGRYLLELLSDRADRSRVCVTLRDRDVDALERGRRLAEQLRLSNVQRATGDAFDAESLASMEPRPDVAIVSGLFELFPDNDRVLRCLRGLARAVPPGGFLVYTNQPWHPQLEMIARVLVHRDGSPWVMRCRPQREMDDLVRSVGFEKVDMRTDKDGIFTVSLARRSTSPLPPGEGRVMGLEQSTPFAVEDALTPNLSREEERTRA
jgi:alpha-beta hydrolase superfamily lysophospholipase/SAM-dependent methyltransferase